MLRSDSVVAPASAVVSATIVFWIVLMRRHGATVAGFSLEELTFRTIYTARNAALQIQAHALGLVSPLNLAEARLAGEYNLRPGPVMRAWEYWNARLDKAEGGQRV